MISEIIEGILRYLGYVKRISEEKLVKIPQEEKGLLESQERDCQMMLNTL
jgi:hypothetical protein